MRLVGIVSVAIILFATSAQGALTLHMEGDPIFRPGEVEYIEIFVTELPPAQDERLVAYAIGLNLAEGSPLIFGPAPLLNEPVDHPFVFPPGTPIDDTGSTANRIRSLASIVTAPVNIGDGAGLLRVPVSLRPGYNGPWFTSVGLTFELSGGLTEFSDDIGQVIPFTPVPWSWIIIPEPSAAAIAAGGLWLLARRRRRAA